MLDFRLAAYAEASAGHDRTSAKPWRSRVAGNDTGRHAPYSAGLASDDALVLEDVCEAAAFFSTIETAMIEPS